MDIGWNIITQSYDKLYSADFKESNTPDVPTRRKTKGQKGTLSGHRYDEDSEIWDNSEKKVWWPWEPNA